MTEILQVSEGQYRVLYALLAGCGPKRAGEALGLEITGHFRSALSIAQITHLA
jgi:hypothetical protein